MSRKEFRDLAPPEEAHEAIDSLDLRHVQFGVDPLGEHAPSGLAEWDRLVVRPELQAFDGLVGLLRRR